MSQNAYRIWTAAFLKFHGVFLVHAARALAADLQFVYIFVFCVGLSLFFLDLPIFCSCSPFLFLFTFFVYLSPAN